MQKRVFIVHGWGGSPNGTWIPWLVRRAGGAGIHAMALFMPDPDEPDIDTWVYHLGKVVENPDQDTFFVGHSIGCQTILRYMSTLDAGVRIGGAVLVAPWIHLNNAAFDGETDVSIAEPWLETPIEWDKIKIHTDRFITIFSDNDPYVPIADSKAFEKELGAKTIIESKKGHLDDVLELPRAVSSLLEMAGIGKN